MVNQDPAAAYLDLFSRKASVPQRTALINMNSWKRTEHLGS